MLSRFSLTAGQNLKTYLLKFQPVSVVTTAKITTSSENTVKSTDPPAPAAPTNYPPEYPPPTAKRDFVNFPRPIWRDSPPPVRLFCIPETWFQFFYPKTGFTGPYVLGTTLLTFLFSKEYIVLNHYFAHVLGFYGLLIICHVCYGDKIAFYFNKMLEKSIENFNKPQEDEKNVVRESIKYLESMKEIKEVIQELTKGTTGIIQLQLELVFRKRLREAYKMVKNNLDCQAELETVERRIIQKNLLDFVLNKVQKSITPELQKNVMQSCIKDLNALAIKS